MAKNFDKNVLFVVPNAINHDDNFLKSISNVSSVNYIKAEGLNVYDLLGMIKLLSLKRL